MSTRNWTMDVTQCAVRHDSGLVVRFLEDPADAHNLIGLIDEESDLSLIAQAEDQSATAKQLLEEAGRVYGEQWASQRH